MPEGFEKQLPAESIADLLAFLTKRGKYLPLDLRKAATIVSTRGMFYDTAADAERLVFNDWSPKTFAQDSLYRAGRPARRESQGAYYAEQHHWLHLPPKMPKSVELPWPAPVAKALDSFAERSERLGLSSPPAVF